MDGKDNNVFSDTDSFWELELLLPKSEKTVYSHRSFDTESKEFVSELKNLDEPPKSEKIPPRPSEYPPITSATVKKGSFESWLEERRNVERNRPMRGKRIIEKYTPDNPLIKSVTVSVDEYPLRSGERFISDAERLYTLEGEFKGNVPFESYYPQYSLMSKSQLECYIGFRSKLRFGEYPKVDNAYIYLYLYELINLVSKQTPEKRVEALCKLINAYHDCDARLFSDMCNWLCDMCLIYKVTIPDGVFGGNIFRIVESASIKEFFTHNDCGADAGISFILSCGRYDFRKSRFYSENKKYYDKYINSAVIYALKKISESDSRFRGSDENVCTLTRESYFGAVCTAAVRRTLSVECVCVTRSESVRCTVTDLIKYAENTLRGFLGIKPRLTVSELNFERKELIKNYFRNISSELPLQRKYGSRVKRGVKTEKIADYEYLYEPKSDGVSFEEAEEIEKSSWALTERLVTEGIEFEEISEPAPDGMKQESVQLSNSEDVCREGLKELFENGEDAFCRYAKENGYIPDALADEINAVMFERLLDVVIIMGNGYEIVSDYETEISNFINKD